MKTYYLALILGALLLMVEGSNPSNLYLNRWRRQVQCQPDDESCQRCSSCSSVSASHLPECCEAYNVCCDEYFQACKQCSSVASKDRYFPEYCCASFTDCCDLITTFTAQVKPPEPVRPKTSSTDLKIPEVAAPKPSSFPGSKPSRVGATQEDLSLHQNTFRKSNFGEAPVFATQDSSFDPRDSVFAPQTQVVRTQEPSFAPAAAAPAAPSSVPRQRRPPASATQPSEGVEPEEVDFTQRQVTRTQARAQVRPQTRNKQQAARQQQDDLDVSSRRGRVTSRGRVSA